jgi:hypothetical protein
MPFQGTKTFQGTKNNPNDPSKNFAPDYVHDPPVERGQTCFFKEELRGLMSSVGPKVRSNEVDFGVGKKATVFKTEDLRLDREHRSHSGRDPGNRHPKDEFMTYSVQANRETNNGYLDRLAQGGNGQHRTQATGGTYGGSTVANVHYQVTEGTRSSKRHGRDLYALEHAARAGEALFVTSPRTNLATVPQGIRQRNGIYQGAGPYAGYEGRANPGNPFHRVLPDGRVPTKCTDIKGEYERYPPDDYRTKRPDHWFRR